MAEIRAVSGISVAMTELGWEGGSEDLASPL